MRIKLEVKIKMQISLPLPMRGYEKDRERLVRGLIGLPLPMRGYELNWFCHEIVSSLVTSPHAGL